jgi:pimeloyl-ACP methyl ester carboxylesterase
LSILLLIVGIIVLVIALAFAFWLTDENRRLNAGSQVIATSLGEIEYALIGETGPVVLSLHGVTGGYDMGQDVAQMLSLDDAGYRILSVSRPGYLRTPLESGVTVVEQADLYAALLDELNIDSVALLAVSGGGPSALEFAHRYPERVWAMVMAVTITRQWQPSAQAEAITSFEQVPPIIADVFFWYTEAFRLRFDRQAFTRQTILENTDLADEAALSSLTESILDDPVRAENLRLSVAFSTPISRRWTGTFNDLEQFESLPIDPDYTTIQAPVIAFYGALDPLVSMHHAELLSEAIIDIEMHVNPIGGHLPVIEDQWSFIVERTQTFLDDHRP